MIGRIYKCDKCTKWHVGSASAFAITSDGVIATNYHVIEDKDGATLGAMDLSGKTYPVTEVLAASKADDVAILRLKGARLTPLPGGLRQGFQRRSRAQFRGRSGGHGFGHQLHLLHQGEWPEPEPADGSQVMHSECGDKQVA